MSVSDTCAVMLAGNAFGGGISSNGPITVSGGVFRSNSALVAGSGQAQGGAISGDAINATGAAFESNQCIATTPTLSGALFCT